MKPYNTFIQGKTYVDNGSGIDITPDDMPAYLFEFQKYIVARALKQGKFCVWANTGMGKTIMLSVWSEIVSKHTNKPTLIIAPLAVSHQTLKEAAKFGIDITLATTDSDIDRDSNKIYVTNYQKLAKFMPDGLGGVVVDESSILKNEKGVTCNEIIEFAHQVSFRLSCSATPSPNDYDELGTQALFVGVVKTIDEMLSMYFTHDTSRASKWELKGHGRKRFWEWVCTWAVLIRHPSDLDFSDKGYDLPDLSIIDTPVQTNIPSPDGSLVWMPTGSRNEKLYLNRESLIDRCDAVADLVNGDSEQWLVWCNSNAESELLTKLIPDSIEVKGTTKDDAKIDAMLGFQEGRYRVLVTKDSIMGFGLNFQNCHKMTVFPNDSYERYYQLIRRCYRFNQTHDVSVYRVFHYLDNHTIQNLARKHVQAELMASEMVEYMKDNSIALIKQTIRADTSYNATEDMILPSWLAA